MLKGDERTGNIGSSKWNGGWEELLEERNDASDPGDPADVRQENGIDEGRIGVVLQPEGTVRP